MSEALGAVYSAADSFKRKLIDALRNPGATLEQVVGHANDRARSFNEMNHAAAQEGANFGPETRRLADALAASYNPSGIFIGAESKLWNPKAAFDATKLAAKNVDPREIWARTQSFKGPDGIWRQEIDDSASMPGHKLYSWGEREDLKQGNSTTVRRQKALLHPQLSAAYPQTKSTIVTLRKGPGRDGVYIDSEFGPSISTKADSQSLSANRSTMLHELQHQIQDIEGFAKGGNPEMFKNSGNMYSEPVLFNAKWLRDNALKQNISIEDLWKKQNRGVFNQTTLDAAHHPYLDDMYQMAVAANKPYESYLRLGGEAEARAVEKRMDYGKDKRRQVFPLDDYDVPLDELILFGKQKDALPQIIDALRKKK